MSSGVASRRSFLWVYLAVMFIGGALIAGNINTYYSHQERQMVIEEEAVSKGLPVRREEEKDPPRVGDAAVMVVPRPKPELEEKVIPLEIRKGDTFIGALSRVGVKDPEALRISKELKPHFDVRKVQAGQKMQLVWRDFPEEGRMEVARLVIDRDRHQMVLTREGAGRYSVKEQPKVLTRKALWAEGMIESSLYELAVKLKVPVPVLVEAIRLMSFDVDFQREIRKGNRFTVLYEELFDDNGNKIDNGHVLYALLRLEDRDVEMYRHTLPDGTEDYFTPDGKTIRKALLKTPIDGARLSSKYGMRRHPIAGYNRMHAGVDFAAPTGTPIYAAGDGVVDYAGRHGGYGNYIRIRHNAQYATAYAHMNRFAKRMKKGVRVRQGQVIGYVGSTGNSTGPHLHYEVWVNGKHTNPLTLKMLPERQLNGVHKAAFDKRKQEVDLLLSGSASGERIVLGKW